MLTNEQQLVEKRKAALALLEDDSSPKGRSLRHEIEKIDPAKATRQQQDRLMALCRRVGKHKAGLPKKKRFERMPDYTRHQNPRGSRGRLG